MFGIIAIVMIFVIVVAAIILGLAARKPDIFRIQRTTTIKAAPAKIFAHINDLHSWGAWSPYEKLDPNMKRTFSGSASGKGAVYEWEGNRNVGKGRMEITESAAPNKITIKLDFMAPFEGHNTAEFTMDAEGDSTEVTWAMYGPCPFMMKIVHVFMNMDKMVGNAFESGLSNLKTICES